MSRYIAAIDQGTTSTRCILFDRSAPVAAAQKEHRQIFPRPGWVEHDPMEIWTRTQEVIRAAIQQVQARPGDIAAVGMTNQRETTLVWERNSGRPICNAIVWQDTRTSEICGQLAREGGQDRFRAATGLPLATYFSGPKLKWILDNVDGARAAADRGELLFGTIDSWLAWWLTGGRRGGVHITDATNASRTLLMNLHTLDWDEQLLQVFGIPRSMLPRIVSSSGRDIAQTLPSGPFDDAIPLCGILGDQQAALVGQACFDPGDSKNTYGTGCFVLLNTGRDIVQSRFGLITTVAYRFGSDAPVYALEGSIAVTGSLVQWLRDNLRIISRSDEVETLARSVENNGGVYIVPAFSGLFAPYWRCDARGIITGLTRHCDKAHIARAALEATAYQTRDVLEAMRDDLPGGMRQLTTLRVDGGMTANELLMQFQADILGLPVIRPRVTETTAQGAAYAAGLAVGFWSGMDDLRAQWRQERAWMPQMPASERDALYVRWKKAVDRSMGWES